LSLDAAVLRSELGGIVKVILCLDCPDESTVLLPPRFIFIKHHPIAEKPNEIIPLESSPSQNHPASDPGASNTRPEHRPYAPFRTFADYKFASRCVKRRMPNTDIDEDLRDMRNSVYSSDCFVTFRDHRDLNQSLAAARVSNVPVSYSSNTRSMFIC
jgi:hypothetical protein